MRATKARNLVAKHSPHRGGKHKDRKRASRQVRGHKHKESGMEDDLPALDINNASLCDMQEFLINLGYNIEGISNEEVLALCVSALDGHRDESEDVEELSFD